MGLHDRPRDHHIQRHPPPFMNKRKHQTSKRTSTPLKFRRCQVYVPLPSLPEHRLLIVYLSGQAEHAPARMSD